MLLAGVDEVGRGPLAGPVVTAAVVLAENDPCLGQYRDSKKLSAKKRLMFYHHLRKHCVAYAVTQASVAEVDRCNILQATLLSMRRSVLALPILPDHVMVDGHHAPELPCLKTETVIGGDAKVQAIAAASIIAKVVRDRLMRLCDVRYPEYGFAAHKGYGTAQHMQALADFGPCPIHRRSFKPVQLSVVRGQ